MTEDQRANPSSFDALVAAFGARQQSANTSAAYRHDLHRFGDWCAQQQLAPLEAAAPDVDRYRAECEAQGLSPATVSRRLASLSSFFSFAVTEGDLSVSPLAGTERPDAVPSGTVALDGAQMAAMIAAGARLGAKTELLVDLLLLDGLKLGEVLAANAEDLADDGTLTVHRRRGAVDLDLQDATAAAVGAYLDGRRQGPLLLSDSPTHEPARLTRFGADYLLKRAAEAAGITQAVSANVLRRSYVGSAHRRGDSVEDIRNHLGHQDSRTTRRHLDPST
ncbi:MAG: tyrosine-type recombinase/integrase [Vicinamibacterales bacterium]